MIIFPPHSLLPLFFIPIGFANILKQASMPASWQTLAEKEIAALFGQYRLAECSWHKENDIMGSNW